MNPAAGGQPKLVHHFSCSTWNMPAPGIDQLGPSPDGALAAYIASVEPVYRVLTALVGQASLLLLLSTDRGLDAERLGRGGGGLAQAQLKEAEAMLASVRVPAPAERHHWLLRRATETLKDILTRLEERSLQLQRMNSTASVDPIRSLRNAYDILQLAALRHLGISTLDLEQACCNCVRRGLP